MTRVPVNQPQYENLLIMIMTDQETAPHVEDKQNQEKQSNKYSPSTSTSTSTSTCKSIQNGHNFNYKSQYFVFHIT